MLIIFDLDDCLIHEGFEVDKPILCDETLQVLTHLHDQGHTLTIGSCNDEADLILKNLGIDHFFKRVLGYIPECMSKNPHVRQLMEEFEADPTQVMLFDDLRSNCQLARQIGIRTCHVDWLKGVTMNDLKFLSPAITTDKTLHIADDEVTTVTPIEQSCQQ